MNMYDIVIIGAGPAGIMAAIAAAKFSSSVLLIEKNEIIGRKILATGNGRCNITNRNVATYNFYGADKEFTKQVLSHFNHKETITFFEDLGLILKEEDRGRLFPRTDQASSVVNVLKEKLDESKVTILTNTLVKKIEKSNSWNISLEYGEAISANKLIVTTGGKAAFAFGSSGDGLFWARNLGHTITPIYAALVPIETKEEWVKEVQGVKVQAKIYAICKEEEIAKKQGDLLFSHFGVTGPAVMSMARKIAPYLDENEVKLQIDLFPDMNEQKFSKAIYRALEMNGKKAVKNALVGFLPHSLIELVLKLSQVDADKKSAEISKIERENIISNIKKFTLTVSKLRPLKEAQVTAGGIESEEINPRTLESNIVKDLYFAGEIIDVDGDSGGFNLQWAWSSGHLAGKSAAKTLQN